MQDKNTKDRTGQSQNVPEQLHDLGKILDFSLDLIFSCDEEGRFVWVNKASERILGYTLNELTGRKYTEFILQEQYPDSEDLDIRYVFEHAIFEKKVVHKNGNIVYLQWSAVWDEAKKLCYCIGRDVTEKIKIEKAFEIERLRFYNLYAQAPSCMGILKGPEHIYTLANDLYLHLIHKKDIIGKTVKEVLPELQAQGIFEILDRVYSTGETFSANEMLIQVDRHDNGQLVDVYLNFIYQAYRDADNKIEGILFFANDVTEQVLSRKKIEEREKMYSDLLHKLPVAAYLCDNEGKLLIYNEAAAALWGRQPQIGSALWYDIPEIKAGNSKPASYDAHPKVLDPDKPNPGREISIERPDGDKRKVLPYPVPIRDTQGHITGTITVLADITEMKQAQKALKKSEKKYRYLFDNNPMPMWVIDLVSFQFLDVNKMAIHQYGYSREEFLSMTALDIRPQEERNLFIKSSDASQINSTNYNRGKWNHLKKDGSVIPVEIIAHDILSDGVPARLILSNDISERQKAEVNLEKRNKELLKTNSELDRFVYSVSHDLRSPLTSILGLLSFIESESLEADTLHHAGLIRSSVNRLDEFIKNILNYSRNSRTGIEVEKISLNAMAHEITDSLLCMKEARGIRCEIAIEELQPFYTDRLRLKTILENLISNALKHHKEDQSDRYIKIQGYSDAAKLHLKVIDNGIGIDPAYHQRIYEMFFRLSGRDGSGIGLYIAKNAIEILEGTIEIQSEKGDGTAFTITLKNLKP